MHQDNPPHPHRVMIIDDEPLFQELMEDIFRDTKIKLTIALNGFEALDQPEHELYIVDQGLPKMDGLTTLNKLKNKFGKSVPALLITGYDTTQFKEKQQEYGIMHILQKPFDVNELFKLINDHFSIK